MSEVVGHMLRVNAVTYSFEPANARHEHEYHLWERVKLPEGNFITRLVTWRAGYFFTPVDTLRRADARILHPAPEAGRQHRPEVR
jgi:hypothetical protein